MFDNRYSRNDLIPMLEDDGVAATLAPLIAKNHSEEYLTETIVTDHGIALLTGQLRQLLADLADAGKLDGADTASLPGAIARPAAPTGIGCNGASVWVNPIEGAIMRFCVNGVFKLSTTVIYVDGVAAGGYISDLATLGAVSGDVVQVCQVVDEVPGWWSRIPVP
jgi:hypothetical protein